MPAGSPAGFFQASTARSGPVFFENFLHHLSGYREWYGVEHIIEQFFQILQHVLHSFAGFGRVLAIIPKTPASSTQSVSPKSSERYPSFQSISASSGRTLRIIYTQSDRPPKTQIRGHPVPHAMSRHAISHGQARM